MRTATYPNSRYLLPWLAFLMLAFFMLGLSGAKTAPLANFSLAADFSTAHGRDALPPLGNPGITYEGTADAPVAAEGGVSVGREVKLIDGFYQAEGSTFKFSEYYYNKLWSTGRGAPFLQAEEVLSTAKTITPDLIKPGFNRYVNDAFEMVYNPTTKEVWHLQPLGK